MNTCACSVQCDHSIDHTWSPPSMHSMIYYCMRKDAPTCAWLHSCIYVRIHVHTFVLGGYLDMYACEALKVCESLPCLGRVSMANDSQPISPSVHFSTRAALAPSVLTSRRPPPTLGCVSGLQRDTSGRHGQHFASIDHVDQLLANICGRGLEAMPKLDRERLSQGRGGWKCLFE